MSVTMSFMNTTQHDFLLMFHSNHRPISHRFLDKLQFLSKIAGKSPIFPKPSVFNAPSEGVPLGIGYWAQWSEETRMMGLPDGQKILR